MHPHGVSIAQTLAGGTLPVETALDIGVQLAAALAQRHAAGRLHLALRPEVLHWDAGQRRLTLLDAPPAPGYLYVAPEQTGRLDRPPDARSDLYLLGLLLHTLLAGRPPLHSDDPLAQVHWHLAGAPEPLLRLQPALPPVLSALVLRLLAKSPDERYQSARGVQRDLAHCAREWAARGAIEPFELGRHDAAPALAPPARLHGRARELHQLTEALEQACAGARRLVLVEGWSGIGKTALVRQLVRPVVQRQGWFIAGKFDQVARGTPFGGLTQALRTLVRQLLGQGEAALAGWRAVLAQALGENGGVLAELLPEIGLIVGAQPAPQPLPGLEAQNRFRRVLQRFIAALAQPGRPLVLFLDDLQWADAATLALLEPLLADPEPGSLLLIGAYRDNELDASPRLAHTLAGLAAAGVALQRIGLGPLRDEDLVALVADTLRERAERVAPLARLVQGKTGGNPFFALRFLHALEQEGHLRHDPQRGAWCWDLDAIARAPLADNVVELMAHGIRRLPPAAQATLTLAACIGNRFDAALLAQVAERAPGLVAQDLAAARAAGLIEPAGGGESGHVFLHDRVQQAAYALVPPERRERLHLAIGRLLRARGDDEAVLFEAVQHLARGRRLIERADERRDAAALHLAAARRAKASAAHEPALEMGRVGLELLGADAAPAGDPLGFALHLETVDSLMLCGRLDEAHGLLDAALARAGGALQQAQALHLRSLLFEAGAAYAQALASARAALAALGAAWPDGPAAQALALDEELAQIETLRGGRPIAALVALPTLQDPTVRLVMGMLTDIWSAAYLVGQSTLARLISARLVRLSLQHGHCEESAYGYVTHAITVGAVHARYGEAYAYGRLALAVNERFGDRRRRAKICQQFHAHVLFWGEPLRHAVDYAREACRAGLDSGDFLYAAYAAGTECWAAWWSAQDLERFEREAQAAITLIERLKNRPFADSVRLLVAAAHALQGRTAGPQVLSHDGFDEAAWLAAYGSQGFFAALHAVLRLQLAVLSGSPAEALQAARHADGLIGHLPGTIWPLAHEFWAALARARAGADAVPALRAAQAAFAARAEHCAENFRVPALLLGAELARGEGRLDDAAARFDAALEFAAAHALVALEALAHERAAALREARGQPHLAGLHAAAAQAAYTRWGARTKAAPAPTGGLAPPPAAPAPAAGDGLDLASVLRAVQAIAAEFDVDTLLARLMHLAIENAGAERGALVLETDEGPQVHAFDGSSADRPAAAGVPLARADSVPAALVNLVRRTGETLVLADAPADETHGADPYVLARAPRSLLVQPVQQQGRLLGVLVLENRRVAGAFGPARLRMLTLLATQAAVSLENARLLAAVEAENSALRRDLIANVSHDLRTPLVSLRGYLELLAARGEQLDPARRREYLGIAVRQSERLGTLIDELFELAKLDFKGMTLQRERFVLAELAADVVQKFRLEAQARGVVLGVQATARSEQVEADLGLTERVFENLVGNALRHTPAGGCVSLRIERRGDLLEVAVADTGRGIPAGELPFLFDRYWRGQASAGSDGAGLGLAITRRILELHGSTIRAESDGTSGSCFRFALPVA